MMVNMVPRAPSINLGIRSINLSKEGTSAENFLMDLEMEVKRNPRKAMKLKSSLIATSMTFGSIFATLNPTTIDPDIVHTLTLLMLTCAGLGVLAAVVGLMAAGVWKMFFGGNQADLWRQNIYRGLGQVILAPVSVALIVGLAVLLFSTVPAFKPIIEPITAWFQKS